MLVLTITSIELEYDSVPQLARAVDQDGHEHSIELIDESLPLYYVGSKYHFTEIFEVGSVITIETDEPFGYDYNPR